LSYLQWLDNIEFARQISCQIFLFSNAGHTAINCFSLRFKVPLEIQRTIDILAKINTMEIAQEIADPFTRQFLL